jgi:hypothetical protein
MTNPRTDFWNRAVVLLHQRPPDFAALDALVAMTDSGRDLIEAANPSDVLAGVEHPLGGPETEQDPGPRGFLVQWSPGAVTGVHGHPPLMYMAALSGCLSIEHYKRSSATGRAMVADTTELQAGQAIHAVADNARYDNFIHRIRAHTPTWSLHIYGEDSGLGQRFDTDGAPE